MNIRQFLTTYFNNPYLFGVHLDKINSTNTLYNPNFTLTHRVRTEKCLPRNTEDKGMILRILSVSENNDSVKKLTDENVAFCVAK